jgi:hypothetical protein
MNDPTSPDGGKQNRFSRICCEKVRVSTTEIPREPQNRKNKLKSIEVL